jgi:hypothetical protein
MHEQYENTRVGHRSSNKTMGIHEKDYLDIDPMTMKTNYQQWWKIREWDTDQVTKQWEYMRKTIWA